MKAVKKTFKVLVLLAAVLMVSATAAQASWVYESGTVDPSTLPSVGYGLYNNPQTFPTQHWVATTFTLGGSDPVTIDEIQAVLGWESVGQSLTFSIYDLNGNVPGTLLYSTAYSTTDPGDIEWIGPSGLNWTLNGGATYFLALEVLGGQTFDGFIPYMDTTNLMAFNQGFGWNSVIDEDIYVRLGAGDTAVPIPGAVWLLGSGLIGLAGVRRKAAA